MPAKYAIFVATKSPSGELGEFFRSGPARTEDEVRQHIAQVRKNFGCTMGGLFAPNRDIPVFKIFQAEWTEISEQFGVGHANV